MRGVCCACRNPPPRPSQPAPPRLQAAHGGVSALLLDSGRLRVYTGGRDGRAKAWDLRKVSRAVR